jgi:hypothetical protein
MTGATTEQKAQIPLLLLCGAIFMGFVAMVASLAVIGTLIGSLGRGPFMINKQPVTRAQFWALGWPILLGVAIIAGAAWAFVYAVWRGRTWSRSMAMLLWLLPVGAIAAEPFLGEDLDGQWIAQLLVVLAAWVVAGCYFYSKHTVVDYYHRLSESKRVA